jgi:hypothetical protein
LESGHQIVRHQTSGNFTVISSHISGIVSAIQLDKEGVPESHIIINSNLKQIKKG